MQKGQIERDRIDTQCGSRMYNAPLAALETPAEQRCDSRGPPFPAATALLASPPFALKVCPPRRPHPLLAPRALHLRVVLLPGCSGVLASGDSDRWMPGMWLRPHDGPQWQNTQRQPVPPCDRQL